MPRGGLELGAVRRLARCRSRRTSGRPSRSSPRPARYGAQVEGEIESITGVEDGIGSDTESARQTLDVSVAFIEATGVDVFAPAIGNAHGVYKTTPKLDAQRVTDVVEATGVPCALHGGSGLTDDAVHRPDRPRLRQGEHLHRAQGAVHEVEPGVPAGRRAAGQVGPAIAFQGRAGARPMELTAGLMRTFGSAGKAG